MQFLPIPPTLLKGRNMDYEKKLKKMDEHLKEHPHDYQTVISRMKTNSDAIDHKRKQSRNERLARLAEIRRQRKERLNVEK